jgi:hypothetical protein
MTDCRKFVCKVFINHIRICITILIAILILNYCRFLLEIINLISAGLEKKTNFEKVLLKFCAKQIFA